MKDLIKDIAIGGVTFAVCEWASEKAKSYSKWLSLAPGGLAVVIGAYGIKGHNGKVVALAGGISVVENLIEVML